jgi:hypothetical protein
MRNMTIDCSLVWDVVYYTDDFVISDTDSIVQLYTVLLLLYRILLQFVVLLEFLYL